MDDERIDWPEPVFETYEEEMEQVQAYLSRIGDLLAIRKTPATDAAMLLAWLEGNSFTSPHREAPLEYATALASSDPTGDDKGFVLDQHFMDQCVSSVMESEAVHKFIDFAQAQEPRTAFLLRERVFDFVSSIDYLTLGYLLRGVRGPEEAIPVQRRIEAITAARDVLFEEIAERVRSHFDLKPIPMRPPE